MNLLSLLFADGLNLALVRVFEIGTNTFFCGTADTQKALTEFIASQAA